MDGHTDGPSYGDARMHLKEEEKEEKRTVKWRRTTMALKEIKVTAEIIFEVNTSFIKKWSKLTITPKPEVVRHINWPHRHRYSFRTIYLW